MAEQYFGPYRLEELIGRGGMGEVHRAFDTVRKRTVALKRLRPSLLTDPEFQARFRAESELAARLRSAHVIPIHDYGEIDGQLFIDMRLVEGEDLADRLTARGGLDPAHVVGVLDQIAGALDAAHAAGLVHRDVKPSNVLLSPQDGIGGRDFAYLVDFGIARAADGTGSLTGSGPIVGTVDYMAPERFERSSADHRVDVYSLTCVLFESLTGEKPFVSDSLAGMLYSHLSAPPPRPSLRRPGVPTAFDHVIARGMAKDPEHRYPTAGALAAAAREALHGRVAAPAPVAVGRHGRPDTAPVAEPTERPTENLRPPRPAPDPPAEDGVTTAVRGRRRRATVAGIAAAAVAVAVAIGGALLIGSNRSGAAALAVQPAAVRVAGVLPIGYATGIVVDPTSSRYFVGANAEDSPYPERRLQVSAFAATGDAAPLRTMPVPAESMVALALSADGRRLAAVSTTLPDKGEPSYALTMIDPDTGAAAGSVPVTGPVDGLALSPDGSRAYLVGGSELRVLDTAAGRLLVSVALGADGQDVAVVPGGGSVLVTCSTGVKVFDAPRYALQHTIGLRDDPTALAVTPDGSRALVLTGGSDALATVDLATRTVTGAIGVGDRAGDVAVTPDGAQALVTNENAGTVTVLNLADATQSTVSVGDRPQELAISPDGTFGLVTTSANVVRLERVPRE
ncbi:MAG TPA: serine/threonine-protein kinase [Pseudonocardia sp.]|nr:serine/threonine-protein kinase [Pseudonocardia sp.]